MSGDCLHWDERKILMTYNQDRHQKAVQRETPALVMVPVTFEDPAIRLHEASKILYHALNKISRRPNFNWLVNIAAGMDTLRPKREDDGFTKGNWVVEIYCHAKYIKEYEAELLRYGELFYEEDDA
jgi:hypothetical protein